VSLESAKNDRPDLSGGWTRDLDADLAAIRTWGAEMAARGDFYDAGFHLPYVARGHRRPARFSSQTTFRAVASRELKRP